MERLPNSSFCAYGPKTELSRIRAFVPLGWVVVLAARCSAAVSTGTDHPFLPTPIAIVTGCRRMTSLCTKKTQKNYKSPRAKTRCLLQAVFAGVGFCPPSPFVLPSGVEGPHACFDHHRHIMEFSPQTVEPQRRNSLRESRCVLLATASPSPARTKTNRCP